MTVVANPLFQVSNKLSRTAIGWIPSRSGDDEGQPDNPEARSNEDEVVDGRSAGILQQAIAKHSEGTTPLSAQGTVSLEANEWGAQWAGLEKYEPLDLPDEANHPPGDLTVMAFVAACLTFPMGTSLGWDGLHPRALCRINFVTL